MNVLKKIAKKVAVPEPPPIPGRSMPDGETLAQVSELLQLPSWDRPQRPPHLRRPSSMIAVRGHTPSDSTQYSMEDLFHGRIPTEEPEASSSSSATLRSPFRRQRAQEPRPPTDKQLPLPPQYRREELRPSLSTAEPSQPSGEESGTTSIRASQTVPVLSLHDTGLTATAPGRDQGRERLRAGQEITPPPSHIRPMSSLPTFSPETIAYHRDVGRRDNDPADVPFARYTATPPPSSNLTGATETSVQSGASAGHSRDMSLNSEFRARFAYQSSSFAASLRHSFSNETIRHSRSTSRGHAQRQSGEPRPPNIRSWTYPVRPILTGHPYNESSDNSVREQIPVPDREFADSVEMVDATLEFARGNRVNLHAEPPILQEMGQSPPQRVITGFTQHITPAHSRYPEGESYLEMLSPALSATVEGAGGENTTTDDPSNSSPERVSVSPSPAESPPRLPMLDLVPLDEDEFWNDTHIFARSRHNSAANRVPTAGTTSQRQSTSPGTSQTVEHPVSMEAPEHDDIDDTLPESPTLDNATSATQPLVESLPPRSERSGESRHREHTRKVSEPNVRKLKRVTSRFVRHSIDSTRRRIRHSIGSVRPFGQRLPSPPDVPKSEGSEPPSGSEETGAPRDMEQVMTAQNERAGTPTPRAADIARFEDQAVASPISDKTNTPGFRPSRSDEPGDPPLEPDHEPEKLLAESEEDQDEGPDTLGDIISQFPVPPTHVPSVPSLTPPPTIPLPPVPREPFSQPFSWISRQAGSSTEQRLDPLPAPGSGGSTPGSGDPFNITTPEVNMATLSPQVEHSGGRHRATDSLSIIWKHLYEHPYDKEQHLAEIAAMERGEHLTDYVARREEARSRAAVAAREAATAAGLRSPAPIGIGEIDEWTTPPLRYPRYPHEIPIEEQEARAAKVRAELAIQRAARAGGSRSGQGSEGNTLGLTLYGNAGDEEGSEGPRRSREREETIKAVVTQFQTYRSPAAEAGSSGSRKGKERETPRGILTSEIDGKRDTPSVVISTPEETTVPEGGRLLQSEDRVEEPGGETGGEEKSQDRYEADPVKDGEPGISSRSGGRGLKH